jgi:hypothetical protein
MQDLFKSIISEQLSSVVFVQDYLQLCFDGNILTCYAWPNVTIDLVNYTNDKPGYKDALCSIIRKLVLDVRFMEETEVNLYFDNATITLNLTRNDSNKDLVEFAYFNGYDGKWFVLD